MQFGFNTLAYYIVLVKQTKRAYLKQYATEPPFDKEQMKSIELFFFRCDKAGAYWLDSKGKLYWDEIIGDGFRKNCEQTALWDNRDQICEVMAKGFEKDGSFTFITNKIEDFIRSIEEQS